MEQEQQRGGRDFALARLGSADAERLAVVETNNQPEVKGQKILQVLPRCAPATHPHAHLAAAAVQE
jgi:hypothetical protein